MPGRLFGWFKNSSDLVQALVVMGSLATGGFGLGITVGTLRSLPNRVAVIERRQGQVIAVQASMQPKLNYLFCEAAERRLHAGRDCLQEYWNSVQSSTVADTFPRGQHVPVPEDQHQQAAWAADPRDLRLARGARAGPWRHGLRRTRAS